MENLGIIIISVAMIFLALTFILLIIELYNYFFDKAGGHASRNFRWKWPVGLFIIYIILIIIGIIIINQ
ncbi:hypothetical protein [Salinicoccus halodurans]|uniref:Mid2-like cell wall stress sensor domain protein n=1 Tax=Salinicoccus halodurans TaxID=407035 RepID=A0A0F7HJM9_9STAP|nr:hypothetical protein [Salinicoccus halodurans]AKG73902.1 hypothetical protein AAT16_06450 [Salinicoccus halodurans]SFK57497.1 hypothetical protein SAMN05216235_0531 [Salinicoccus halodurans]